MPRTLTSVASTSFASRDGNVSIGSAPRRSGARVDHVLRLRARELAGREVHGVEARPWKQILEQWSDPTPRSSQLHSRTVSTPVATFDEKLIRQMKKRRGVLGRSLHSPPAVTPEVAGSSPSAPPKLKHSCAATSRRRSVFSEGPRGVLRRHFAIGSSMKLE